ncbi:ADP-ribosylglycohydrolase family protein [Aurantiacibacter zhengii]|uniref:ADP-ribosylglycohydrolase family protein n=1 Tax=Aurantiacibacter zhengii TaxID=2307003 RepID=UPI0018F3EC2D|nr:ADP-ribosylglycohydrolase family protein [Aurantiacibacter zhengii]
MSESPALRNRARGALLGLAVGDAVGTTLEFAPRDTLPALTDMSGGGPFGLKPGQWTDDTAMALALADSLVTCGRLNPCDLAERFASWMEHGEYSCTGSCFDIGNATREALLRYREHGEPLAGSDDPRSAGNGSLMRLAPVAIRGVRTGEGPMAVAARTQSRVTHAARACLDACEAWATAVRAAILGASFEGACTAVSRIDADDPAVAAILQGHWRGKIRDQIASSGYVVHSLEASFWCVAQGGSFADMVLRAANLGDDADTTAAITGQLAGALAGEEGIPQAWLDKLAWRDRISDLADALLDRGEF